MPDWTIDIQGPNGGANLVTAAPFKTAKFSWSIDGPGFAEVEINPSQMSTYWRTGLHRIVANAPSGPGFAGYLTFLSRDGRPGPSAQPDAAATYKASGQGLASILDWRIIRHPFVIVDNLDDIVSNILDELQIDQVNGDMGLQMGTTVGSFPSRRRSYCRGVVASDAINELSGAGPGFDWEIDEDGNINLWAPARGEVTGFTLDHSDTTDWQVTSDTSELVTTVTALGDSNRPWGPISRKYYNNLADDFGRHEVAVDVDSNDFDDLYDAAWAVLDTQGSQRVRLKVTWIEGRGPWDWGDVWLNDRVEVNLGDYFGGDGELMRCIETAVTLEPGVHQFVEMTFEKLVHDIAEDTSEGDTEVEDSSSG